MAVPTSRSSAAASKSPCLVCRPAASAAELAAHFRIRHRVFVKEQGLFNGRGGPGHDRDTPAINPATIPPAAPTAAGARAVPPSAPRSRPPLPPTRTPPRPPPPPPP